MSGSSHRKKGSPHPLLRLLLMICVIAFIVPLSILATKLIPRNDADQSAVDIAEFTPEPVPESTPESTPDPNIATPTPAVYAPFGAQYGYGGEDLLPETPTPTPTPTPPLVTLVPVVTATPDIISLDPTPTPAQIYYTTLARGSKGPDVVKLQEALIELGYLNSEADGDYGPKTVNAVISFQSNNNLSADGIAGQKTQEALFSGSALSAADVPEMDFVMLVNRENKLPMEFIPSDLVEIESIIPPDVIKVKYKGTKANRTAVEALSNMIEDAIDDGVTDWQVSSAYRTYAEQQNMVDESVAGYKERNPSWSTSRCLSATYQTIAPAGASEHQTGLCFDITVPGVSFAGTPQQIWLHEHCYEYGFIIHFTKEKEAITGFLAEPWHIRYVGTEAASVMTYHDWCLEEYTEEMGK